jgi:UDP-GlcNAc:undecaprenyl-phosphate/decaprenyl-phosphate GlcNAc-1-phosphate transferase
VREFTALYTMSTVNLSPLVTTPLLAFTCAILLHVLALRFFPRIGLLDFPERYGHNRPPLPYPTGLIAVAVFIVFFGFMQPLSQQNIGLIVVVTLLACTCFIDDRRMISPFIRLIIHILCAWLIVWSGDCTGGQICSITNPLAGIVGGDIIELNGAIPALSFIVTIAWLFVTTNALNWFDGIPGQTSAISTIGFFTIGFLSLSDRVDQPALALIAFVLGGVGFASFLFDMPPPRVVLGDTGSMFFGLMLGVLTIYSGGKVATAFLVLGVPIIDFIFVIVRRIATGRSPMRGSMHGEHLHHRLMEKGWSPRTIIALTAGIGTAFGITALFLDTLGKFIAGGLLFVSMGGLSFYSGKRKS